MKATRIASLAAIVAAAAFAGTAFSQDLQRVKGVDLFVGLKDYAGKRVILIDAYVFSSGNNGALVRAGAVTFKLSSSGIDRESLRYFLTNCAGTTPDTKCQMPLVVTATGKKQSGDTPILKDVKIAGLAAQPAKEAESSRPTDVVAEREQPATAAPGCKKVKGGEICDHVPSYWPPMQSFGPAPVPQPQAAEPRVAQGDATANNESFNLARECQKLRRAMATTEDYCHGDASSKECTQMADAIIRCIFAGQDMAATPEYRATIAVPPVVPPAETRPAVTGTPMSDIQRQARQQAACSEAAAALRAADTAEAERRARDVLLRRNGGGPRTLNQQQEQRRQEAYENSRGERAAAACR